jgi:hypothetical protein
MLPMPEGPGHLRTHIAEPYLTYRTCMNKATAINNYNEYGYIAVCMPIVKDKINGNTK